MNKIFIKLLNELEEIMIKKGEIFRARAYKKGSEAIMKYSKEIENINELKEMKGIGKTIISKLDEYVKTGRIEELENEKNNPIIVLSRVYGIGPKKAQELINSGIRTIEELKINTHLLTNSQKLGLKYLNDIEERIPRYEIDKFNIIFNKILKKYTPDDTTYEIVGSYRRGLETSGDIDIIITNKRNITDVFNMFIDGLFKEGILKYILSKGNVKCLSLGKISNKMRRIDILYSPLDEYAFSLLYFTGSKTFNTLQRQRALDMNYTLNEHGIYNLENGKKTTKVKGNFSDEESIFKLLKMEYRDPSERIDINSVKYINNEIEKKDDNIEINLINQYKKDGIEFLKKLRENSLNNMIKLSNYYYYNNDNPIMSDYEYDLLVDYVISKYPKNSISKEGHTCIKINSRLKTKLPYEMWSLNKIKPNTNLVDKWKQRFNGPYVISCKLDGVSGLYSTENDVPKLFTRGNGVYGQDISHMIPYLKLPNIKGIVIRGEFVISKELFKQKYSSEFSNSRNFVAGIVNKNKISVETLNDIDFVGYELIKPEFKPSEQFQVMNKLNMNVLNSIILKDIRDDMLSKILSDNKNTNKYEIDGIVCVDDNKYDRLNKNPEHAFAFKMLMNDQVMDVNVLDVLWSASKDGYLKPRIKIEPVYLCGAKIEYTTGFNGKFIKDNEIGIGSVLRLVRSGDVIPHILKVLKRTKAKMPEIEYIWNDTRVDILLKNKSENIEVIEKNIIKFFKDIGVEGLSTGNIKKVVLSGYNTIPKILKMGKDDYMRIDGFKDKLSLKIINSIKKSLSNIQLARLLSATNIIGRGFGEKKIKIILEAYPNILIENISNIEKVEKIKLLNGMSTKSAELFVSNINRFLIWLKESNLEYILEKSILNTKKKDNDHVLCGSKYVITGFRDKELEKKLEELGCKQMSSISKNVNILIVKDMNQYTYKIEQAKKLSINIISKEDFIEKYKL